MKKIFYLSLLAVALIASACSDDNESPVTPELPALEDIEMVVEDAGFKAYMQSIASKYDTDGNGKLSSEEVKGITSLTFGEEIVEPTMPDFDEDIDIEDGMGTVEETKLLKTAKKRAMPEPKSATYNIKSLKGIEYFTGLKELVVSGQEITSIDLRWNLDLEVLRINNTGIVNLDLSENGALVRLSLYGNKYLDVLVLGDKPHLEWFWSQETSHSAEIDFDKCPRLRYVLFYTYFHPITFTSLDLSRCEKLEYLDVTSCDKMTDLNIIGCKSLKRIECSYNMKLVKLDVSGCTNLVSLNCGDNPIESLDVSKNKNLKNLKCFGTKISSLDVSKNEKLASLSCNDLGLQMLDLSNNKELTSLSCNSNSLTTLDLSNNVKLKSLTCFGNKFGLPVVPHPEILIGLQISMMPQESTVDISQFTNLLQFTLIDGEIGGLDLSKNTKLAYLTLNRVNKLPKLDLSYNPEMLNVFIKECQALVELDISKSKKLNTLRFYDQNSSLKTLYVWNGFDTVNPTNTLYSYWRPNDTFQFVVK